MITIVQQPVNCITQIGLFAEFKVEATSNKQIYYQWRCREYNYQAFTPIIGADSDTYKFVLNVNYGWEYDCLVSDEDMGVSTNIVTTIQRTTVPAMGYKNGWYYEEVYAMPGFTQDMRLHNIQKFVNILSWWGWTMNAISAVAGNVWLECDTSPGTWQEFDYMYGPQQDYRGYGFVQWSPTFHLTNWIEITYPMREWRNDGDLQIARLYYEWQNNLEWGQWENFVHSTDTVENLCMQFIIGYLGVQPGSESTWPARKAQAEWIYNNITPCPHPLILKKMTERRKVNERRSVFLRLFK